MYTLKFSVSTSFALSTALIICSCVRDFEDLESQDCGNRCTVVRGVLTTDDGQVALPGTRVIIEHQWNNLLVWKFKTKAEAYTDEIGNYRMQFEARDYEMNEGVFVLKAFIDDQYFSCSDQPFVDTILNGLQFQNTNFQNLYVPYRAMVNITPVDTHRITASDYLALTIYPSISENAIPCQRSMNWVGPYRNKSYNLSVPGNQDLIFETIIDKGTERTVLRDTLYIRKGETINRSVVFN